MARNVDQRPPFHLAIPVDDLDRAREFYCGLLGCATGRDDERWLDLDFFGHQVTLHLAQRPADAGETLVDGDRVPVPHFGAVLEPGRWRELSARLESAGVDFLLAPRVRFAGLPGEQSTLFLRDPAGNVLELKSFADRGQLFAR